MNVATQISGRLHPKNVALNAFEHLLTQLGIYVTQPLQDESFFYKTDMNTAWQRYIHELNFYESIADSNFHIIYNDEPITERTSQQILYAMLKDRPIVITGNLTFSTKVSPFTQDIIRNHIHEFHSVDLPELDLTELSKLLHKLQLIDYRLLGSEKILINSRIKAHFRALLDQAKENAV